MIHHLNDWLSALSPDIKNFFDFLKDIKVVLDLCDKVKGNRYHGRHFKK